MSGSLNDVGLIFYVSFSIHCFFQPIRKICGSLMLGFLHHLIGNFAYLPAVKTHLAGRGPLLSLLYIISPFLTPPYTCLSYTNTVSSTILYSYSHSAGFKALMGATNHQETKVGINCWFFFFQNGVNIDYHDDCCDDCHWRVLKKYQWQTPTNTPSRSQRRQRGGGPCSDVFL